MSIKTQLLKLKENWLIIVVLLIIIIIGAAVIGNTAPGSYRLAMDSVAQYGGGNEAFAERGLAIYPATDQDFAPRIEERKVVKTAELSTEVKRGEFLEEESQLKNIIDSSDSYLINESVNKNGAGVEQYYLGRYEIKVEAGKYDAVIAQLKEIGEVQKFEEGAEDVTAGYADLAIELAAEKARLERYRTMYSQAVAIEDKINLNDRIFNQERTVKYYEDRLATMDSRIDYSTLNVTLTEKKSAFFSAKFVEFSELARTIISSLNSLIILIFAVFPYLILIGLIYLTVRMARSRKRR